MTQPGSTATGPEPASVLGDATDATEGGGTVATEGLDQDPTQEQVEDVTGAVGAPEEYAPFEIPEGMQASEEELSQFAAVARELNLTQEAAQKLVQLESQRMQMMMASQQQQYEQQVQAWIDQIKNDPEMGGVNFDKTKAFAARAINRFGGADLRDALDMTGAGNHPAMVKAFYQIGKLISEDSLNGPGGKATQTEPKSVAERLYPTHAQGG